MPSEKPSALQAHVSAAQREQLDKQVAAWQRRMRQTLSRTLLRPATHLDLLPYLKSAKVIEAHQQVDGVVLAILVAVPACSTAAAHVHARLVVTSQEETASALPGSATPLICASRTCRTSGNKESPFCAVMNAE